MGYDAGEPIRGGGFEEASRGSQSEHCREKKCKESGFV